MRGERGQSTVELALCLPLVCMLMAVVVQVGGLAVDHVRLWHAAREAGRVAAVDGDPEAIRQAATAAGLEPIDVRVTPATPDRTLGAPVVVRVSHRPIVNVPLLGRVFDDVTFEADASFRIETP